VDLAACKLVDADASFLSAELRHAKVTYVNFSNNAFTNAGVMQFVKLLKANKGIETFVLRHEEQVIEASTRKSLQQAWHPRDMENLDLGIDAKLTKADRIAVHDSRHSWSGEFAEPTDGTAAGKRVGIRGSESPEQNTASGVFDVTHILHKNDDVF